MNIFCDTNIILEFLEKRKFSEQVRQILVHSTSQKDSLFISFGSFYTITYLVERYLKENEHLGKKERIAQLRYILNGVLDTFKLAGQKSDSIIAAVNDCFFDDLEDSYQAHIAEDMGCDVLLTINDRHFAKFASASTIEVLTPIEFVAKYAIKA